MRTIFVVLSVICLLLGLGSCATAKTVIHEISAYVWMLMATVFFVGAAVLEELQRIRKAAEPSELPVVSKPAAMANNAVTPPGRPVTQADMRRMYRNLAIVITVVFVLIVLGPHIQRAFQ